MLSVAVYCGARHGGDAAYAQAARRLGQAIGERAWQLVYGGGNVGLMGVIADAALAAGGEVIGVIPEQLAGWEVAHQGLTRLEVVADMHTRKARMFDLADAFVALPGGFGTLDEMFEVLTLTQTGKVRKRPIVLVGREFWNKLIDWEWLVETGMIAADDLKLFHLVETAEEAWAVLESALGLDAPETMTGEFADDV